MIEVELVQIEWQEEVLRKEEKKLRQADEHFQDVMISLKHFMNIDDFPAVQSRIGRQMDENRDGMRKMADGLGRVRQIYRDGERRIVDRTEEEQMRVRMSGRGNWNLESGYMPDGNMFSNPFPPIDPEDILSGMDD